MMTPSAIEEFLPSTVDVCRDFVQMVGDKVERGEGRLDSDFLEELKKYFLEVGGLPAQKPYSIQGCKMAKFDPFLSLDCAPTPSTLWSSRNLVLAF